MSKDCSITRFRGDTYSIEAILTKNDTPVDFTVNHSTAKFGFARGTKRRVLQGVHGTFDGHISFPFPADVAAGEYTYDIQVISATGEIRTYVKDVMTVSEDIAE